MICCVILVCFLSRDFGPMLTAERKARRLLATRLVGSLEEQRDEGEDERREEGASQEGPAGEGNGAREEQEQHGSDDLLAGKYVTIWSQLCNNLLQDHCHQSQECPTDGMRS